MSSLSSGEWGRGRLGLPGNLLEQGRNRSESMVIGSSHVSPDNLLNLVYCVS